MTGVEPPRFHVGQEVLVDEGLPGEITVVKRGTVPGILDLPPEDTWLYTVDPGAGGELQTDVPEYNVVTRAETGLAQLLIVHARGRPASTTAPGHTLGWIRTSDRRIGRSAGVAR
jgi:hypothetical protein